MWERYKQWRQSVRDKREAAANAFLKSGKTDLAVIDAKYGELEKTCMNCHAPLQGPFCRACGQRDDDLRRPIWTFLRQLLDSVFDADNKIFKTLILLVLVPGGLTRAYVSGRRATFTPPLRLYLVISVLFFLFLSATDLVLLDIRVTPKAPVTTEQAVGEDGTAAAIPQSEEPEAVSPEVNEDASMVEETGEKLVIATENRLEEALSKMNLEDRAAAEQALERLGVDEMLKGDPMESGTVNISNGNIVVGDDIPFDVDVSMFRKPNLEDRVGITEETLAEILEDTSQDKFVKDIVKGAEKLLLHPELSNELFNDWLPRIMIFIVPIFALFLRMTHWGKRRYYFNQLVFSLHFHSFLFLLMGSLMVIIPSFGSETGAMVFLWGSMIYLFISLKVAQDQGWFRTIFKFLIVAFIYIQIITIGLFTILAFGLQEI